MADLTTKERKKLPKKDFGLPGARKYPMENAGHAKAAKSRASEMEHKGKMSKGTEEKIDTRADRVLGTERKKDESARDRMRKEGGKVRMASN